MSHRLTKNLVGHWPLNNHADDVSGYGNDGTFAGGAYTDGPYGRSIGDFNGSSYIDTLTKFDIDNKPFSASMHLNLQTDGSRGGMFQRLESGTFQGFFMGKASPSNILVRLADTSGNLITISVAQNLDVCTHYCMTYNPTTKTMNLYVDREFAATATNASFTNVMTVSAQQNMQFMGRGNGTAFVTGEAFSFRFYEIDLTYDEVITLNKRDKR